MTDSSKYLPKREIGCSEHGLRALSLRERFELLKNLGIEALELRLGKELSEDAAKLANEEQLAELRSLRDQFKISTPFCSVECDLTSINSADSNQNLTQAIEHFRTAASIGARTINLTVTQVPTIEVTESIWERFVESLCQLGEEASQLGLSIALKTNGHIEEETQSGLFIVETLMTNRSTLTRLMPTLPSNVGFGYSPGMFKAVNPSDLRFGIDIIEERTETCFLQDWRQQNRSLTGAVIGADDLDYRSLLRRLPTNTPCLISLPSIKSAKVEIETSMAYLNRILAP